MFFVTNFTISGHENVHFVHGRDGRQKVMVSDNFCINSVHPSPNAFAPADGDGWDGETLVQPLFSLQKNWFFFTGYLDFFLAWLQPSIPLQGFEMLFVFVLPQTNELTIYYHLDPKVK